MKDPTVWTDATAVTDAQNAINAYGSNLKAIYSQWSSPDLGILPLLKSKGFGPAGSAKHVILISDDGVAFEMCNIGSGWEDASSSQPANLYAYWALQYAKDAALGVVLKPGDAGGGAPALQNVSFTGDSNLGDPIVAPFVTKTALHLTDHAGGRHARKLLHYASKRRRPLGQRLRQGPRRSLLRVHLLVPRQPLTLGTPGQGLVPLQALRIRAA